MQESTAGRKKKKSLGTNDSWWRCRIWAALLSVCACKTWSSPLQSRLHISSEQTGSDSCTDTVSSESDLRNGKSGIRAFAVQGKSRVCDNEANIAFGTYLSQCIWLLSEVLGMVGVHDPWLNTRWMYHLGQCECSSCTWLCTKTAIPRPLGRDALGMATSKLTLIRHKCSEHCGLSGVNQPPEPAELCMSPLNDTKQHTVHEMLPRSPSQGAILLDYLCSIFCPSDWPQL